MALILSTRNPHKLREFARLLTVTELEPLPADIELPPETGDTYLENALGKARTAAHATGRPTIADDSGIEAAALDGRPGVRSARYAGEHATDEENLSLFIKEVPPGTALTYVCALVYIDPHNGEERTFEGRCEGVMAPRPCAAELRSVADRTRGLMADDTAKGRAAALSVASNTTLIAIKVIAGIATGSVALLTEAAHSAIDLLASIVAFVSVRKADEPADAEHRYGHEKIENLAAAIEGALILFGAAIISYEAISRLIHPQRVHTLGIGIAVIGVSAVVNLIVSRVIAGRARETSSVALAGDATHLSADAASSVAVLAGLVLIAVTHAYWIDPTVALAVALWIVVAGLALLRRSSRALVDESLPDADLETIRAVIHEVGAARGMVGFHKLRTRGAGARRYVDVHVQFAAGTTLEAAHQTAHVMTDEIRARLHDADVLVHLEPADRVLPESDET
jgi:non-canonical purine NTP pyrophosphatase (RdgB/HAM1 family)